MISGDLGSLSEIGQAIATLSADVSTNEGRSRRIGNCEISTRSGRLGQRSRHVLGPNEEQAGIVRRLRAIDFETMDRKRGGSPMQYLPSRISNEKLPHATYDPNSWNERRRSYGGRRRSQPIEIQKAGQMPFLQYATTAARDQESDQSLYQRSWTRFDVGDFRIRKRERIQCVARRGGWIHVEVCGEPWGWTFLTEGVLL